jgi:uncharacterized phage protein gp47/JayE
MPWSTPTLRQVRSTVRDFVHAMAPGSDATVPNSVLRVVSDVTGALCHLTLQYVDWLSKQLLPDTAEQEWLDRHGQIWLLNSDGSMGRKLAAYSQGSATFTGTFGAIIPASSQLVTGTLQSQQLVYEALEEIVIGNGPTEGSCRALDPGADHNLDPGTLIALLTVPPGVDAQGVIVTMQGGTDTETDDELRARVLLRIRQPPMGGDQKDYVQWALAVPGVTRAWCGAHEMGIGTVTVRFMMDDVNADNDGFPTAYDIAVVTAYLDTVRPVTVQDFYVVSPIPQPIDLFIGNLVPDTTTIRGMIQTSLQDMLIESAAPGQTIFTAWKYYAIMSTPGVVSFDLPNDVDEVMPSPGHMATLGDIVYASVAVAPAPPAPPATPAP